MRYSSKRSDFLRLYLYLYHVLMILLVVKRITNVSKNLTQQNPEQFFAAQELISNVKLKRCGI